MKNLQSPISNIKYIWIAIFAVICSACSDPLKEPVKFSVTMQNNLTMGADSFYVAPQGTVLQFVFDANADIITEQHSIFNEADASLGFVTSLSWADNPGALRVLLGTDFPGLSHNNEADKNLVHSYAWTDITDSCHIPAVKATSDTTLVNMSEYADQSVVIAFCYKTEDNSGFQPMFVLRNMLLQSWVRKTGEVIDEQTAPTMAFTPFDVLLTDSTAYESSDAGGRWDISFSDPADKTAVKIRQSAANRSTNEDWLISRPLAIPRGKQDYSATLTLKNIHTHAEGYSLKLDEPGEWIVTFRAFNENYKHHSSAIQTYKFLVK